ncbi:MAG: hypothetical protein ABIZ52_01020 [Candidatus Limnocylindrales bacterium]
MANRMFVASILSIVFAVGAGLSLAVLDSQPGYDATGVTAVGLAIAALIAVLIEGSARIVRVASLAVLVGIWIPILEIAAPGAYSSLLSFVFSAVGAFIGWVIARGLARPDHGTAP